MGKKYSDLDSATSIYNGDLACLAQVAQEGEVSDTGFISRKTTVTDLASKLLKGINFSTDLANYSTPTIIGAIGKMLVGTLIAGQTSITLSDASITTGSNFDFFTDTFGVNPSGVSVSTGSITLTFPEQASDVSVKVRVF